LGAEFGTRLPITKERREHALATGCAYTIAPRQYQSPPVHLDVPVGPHGGIKRLDDPRPPTGRNAKNIVGERSVSGNIPAYHRSGTDATPKYDDVVAK
jgi:hypothetical protein